MARIFERKVLIQFKEEDSLFSLLKERLLEIKEPRKLATFDADGTIWLEDANDQLLEIQEEKGLRDYKELLKKEYLEDGTRYKRCLYFAKKQAGFTLEEFRTQAREALNQRPFYIFPFIRKAYEFFKVQRL